MTGDNRPAVRRQVSFDDMQVGPADAADFDLNQYLACAGFGNRQLGQHERRGFRLAGLRQKHRLHRGRCFHRGRHCVWHHSGLVRLLTTLPVGDSVSSTVWLPSSERRARTSGGSSPSEESWPAAASEERWGGLISVSLVLSPMSLP